MSRRSITIGRALLLAGALGCSTDSPTTGPAAVASVDIVSVVQTLVVGQTTQLSAIPRDGSGAPLLDRDIEWSTAQPLIASVAADGLVLGLAPGDVVIKAHVEGKEGEVELTVRIVPVAAVTVDPGVAALTIGASKQLLATPRDANGQPLNDREVAWTSSNPAIVSVAGDGTATGHAAGFATITAESEGRQRGVDVTVCSTSGVFITGVFPTSLTPGGQGTIAGCNFAPTIGANAVTLDGRALTVQAATPNELRVTMPTTGYTCEPTKTVTLAVTAAGVTTNRQQRLSTGSPHFLAAGQSVSQLDPAMVRCNELMTSGARYIISVFNTTAAPSVQTTVQLRGVAGATITPLVAGATSSPLVQLARSPSGGQQPPFELDDQRPGRRAHMEMLDHNRAILRALGNPKAGLMRRRGSPGAPVTGASIGDAVDGAAVPPGPSLAVGAVGDVRQMRVWRRGSGSCNEYDEVSARTVYVGTRSIIMEDQAAPLAGQMDEMYVTLGHEFDQTMFPILQQNFGNPLALDDQLDDNDRIVMVFTRRVNDDGLAGFVVSCDFFPRASAASSNEGEVFYAFVPTHPERGYISNAFTRDEWRREIRSTLIHEAKHITAFAERIDRGASDFEESWLEEGTAMHAEEIWSRLSYGSQWKGNTTYRNSIYCDARQTIPECADAPFVMFSHFAYLYDYLESVEDLSPLGRTGEGDATFYGSAWAFVRWLIDHHAASDAAFLGPLVRESSLTGLANIAARTGKTFPELLGDWSLAMIVDDYSGFTAARPQLSFPSWQTRDIYLALNRDFTGFPRSFPVAMRPIQFGTFAVDVTVRGGTAAIFELTGSQSATQLLELRTAANGPPPSNFRIAIVRVQ